MKTLLEKATQYEKVISSEISACINKLATFIMTWKRIYLTPHKGTSLRKNDRYCFEKGVFEYVIGWALY